MVVSHVNKRSGISILTKEKYSIDCVAIFLIDYILATVMDADRLPRDYKALKRHNPYLIPSPEEEMDEKLVSFYDLVREFYAVGDELKAAASTIGDGREVDDEFLANRAEGKAIIEEARKEAIKCFDFSDLYGLKKREF
jgi:hypothetical protein